MKKVFLFIAMVTVSVVTWAQNDNKTSEDENQGWTVDEEKVLYQEGDMLLDYDVLKSNREGMYRFKPEDSSDESTYYYDFGAIVSIRYVPQNQVYSEYQKKLSSLKEKYGSLKPSLVKRGYYAYRASNEVGVVFCKE